MDEDLIGQNEIEELLKAAGGPAPSPPPTPEPEEEAPEPPASSSAAAPAPDLAPMAAAVKPEDPPPAEQPLRTSAAVGDDIHYLLSQAEEALASAERPVDRPLPDAASKYQLRDFGGAPLSTDSATIDLLRDIELDLKIELGRTDMLLEDVLKLRKGSVVSLDKLAGDPVDVYVNGRMVARGEVLVLNDNFCVRVAELVTGEEA